MKIMLIDDDTSLQSLVEQIVVRDGFEFCGAGDGESGLEMLRQERPDLLILDVMLPDINGFEICSQIRSEGRKVPIIFLSAKGDIVDKSIGFNAGADDYLVKPFATAELLLRINAHLRRRRGRVENSERILRESGLYRVGDLQIAFGKYEVHLRGEDVALSSREFELLELLASDPGSVFTRKQILDHIWKDSDLPDPNSVTVYVRKIREKIEDDPSKPRYLITVWRVGYKLAGH
ncbi:MAG: response regulator transcription factor [Coriobacteriales bacterium]|jgi:DNA-binding response OmpR family regulator|nr:response regulator transcription factor [Coriobacteriales bacterium]